MSELPADTLCCCIVTGLISVGPLVIELPADTLCCCIVPWFISASKGVTLSQRTRTNSFVTWHQFRIRVHWIPDNYTLIFNTHHKLKCASGDIALHWQFVHVLLYYTKRIFSISEQYIYCLIQWVLNLLSPPHFLTRQINIVFKSYLLLHFSFLNSFLDFLQIDEIKM